MVYSLPMDSKQADSIHAAIECLQRLSEVFQQRRVQLAQSVGLSEQQWATLEQISSEHFMPSMFARSRDSSAAAVSKILRQLVDKGFIVAAVDKLDARQRRYDLTATGKRVMATLRKSRERAIEAAWLPLVGGDMEAFTRFGKQLTQNLENYASQGSRANVASRSTRLLA